MLIAVCGLMGTGKSTLAAALAEKTGFQLIRSDEVRKAMADIGQETRRRDPFGEGIYSKEHFDATYGAMLERAAVSLDRGEGVILDASFKKRRYRQAARKTGEDRKVPFLLIECRCGEAAIRLRLEAREREGLDASDGRWEIFARQKEDFEAIAEGEKLHHLAVDTERGIAPLLPGILADIEKFLEAHRRRVDKP